MWSSLPAEILGIVKDKLDVFDIACVNSVCQNWWFASKNYPQRQTVGDGIPWIIKFCCTSLEVISVTREKKIIVELPKSSEGRLHFSKQGWILISVSRSSRPFRWVPEQLLLLNPLTRAMIELPNFGINPSGNDQYSICCACFSIVHGRPHHVVLYTRDLDGPSKLSGVKVGDAVWTDYYNNWQMLQMDFTFLPIIGLLVIGPCIYCCNSYGEIIFYNVDTQVWKEVKEDMGTELQLPSASKIFYADYNGKLVLNGDVNGDNISFCYDDSDDTWKRLSVDFKINKSIFNNIPISFFRSLQECLELYPDLHEAATAAYIEDKMKVFAWVDMG